MRLLATIRRALGITTDTEARRELDQHGAGLVTGRHDAMGARRRTPRRRRRAPDDADILVVMDDRDADAFRALYRRHYRSVCRFLATRTAADHVEDLARPARSPPCATSTSRRRTTLPVRIVDHAEIGNRAQTIFDLVVAEQLPLNAQTLELLRMAPHPGAREVDEGPFR